MWCQLNTVTCTNQVGDLHSGPGRNKSIYNANNQEWYNTTWDGSRRTYAERLPWPNHLIFNLRCKSKLLTPKSLQICLPIKTSSGTKIAEKASRLFLMERIRVTLHQKRRVLEKLKKVENELKTTLSPADFHKISQTTNRAAESTFSRSREKHYDELYFIERNNARLV